jgi:hypothetical protein
MPHTAEIRTAMGNVLMAALLVKCEITSLISHDLYKIIPINITKTSMTKKSGWKLFE